MFQTTFDEVEKLWSGAAVPPLYNPKISVAQVLLRTMELQPQKIAQISVNNGVRLSYDELYTQSVRAAQNLKNSNFKKGDVVAIVSKNNHELLPILVALLSLDYPINPLDPLFTEEFFLHIFSITKPKLVFCDLESSRAVRKYLQQLNNDAKIYTFCGQIDDSLAVSDLFTETGEEVEFIPTDIDGENDIAVIFCSSGTTGLPKPICLTHATILDHVAKSYKVTGNDTLLCFSRCSWLSGIMVPIVSILSNATRIITTEKFTPKLMLQIVENYKVTFMYSSTFHWLLVLKSGELSNANLSSLKQCTVIGTKLPLSLATALMKYMPNGQVNTRYGLTETCGCVTMNYPFAARETVGRLNSGIQVKIIDDEGNRLGIGEEGEICLKMTYRFAGYYGKYKSDDIFYDSEGFLRTGDIGCFDADGFLDFIDRKKDMIRYSGHKISPTEIETFLLRFSGIKSVCVVAVNDTTRYEIEMPTAVVVRNVGSNISANEICDSIADNFDDFKRLRGGVLFVDTFPINASGKILRRQVKQIAIDSYNLKC